ncbi:type II toxin-antitoxin system RelE/ParE family toxin [Nanoarchaeota archaeon]
MDLSFKFTKHFLEQWKNYDSKTRNLIQNKLRLIKHNPFRFPSHEGYKLIFKVKLSIESKYSRLMYAVFMPDSKHITILGIFERKSDYKDFERIFEQLRKK